MTFVVAYEGTISGGNIVTGLGNPTVSGSLVVVPSANGQRVVILNEV